jgi:hypothetical protein
MNDLPTSAAERIGEACAEPDFAFVYIIIRRDVVSYGF